MASSKIPENRIVYIQVVALSLERFDGGRLPAPRAINKQEAGASTAHGGI